MNWYKKAQQVTKAIRFTHANGMGLLNNQGLDRDKLTDDEEFELIEEMDLGLRQPPLGTQGIFYFTEEGEKRHARMIDLLSKASITGAIRTEIYFKGNPLWQSDDGQITLDPSQIVSNVNPEWKKL